MKKKIYNSYWQFFLVMSQTYYLGNNNSNKKQSQSLVTLIHSFIIWFRFPVAHWHKYHSRRHKKNKETTIECKNTRRNKQASKYWKQKNRRKSLQTNMIENELEKQNRNKHSSNSYSQPNVNHLRNAPPLLRKNR